MESPNANLGKNNDKSFPLNEGGHEERVIDPANPKTAHEIEVLLNEFYDKMITERNLYRSKNSFHAPMWEGILLSERDDMGKSNKVRALFKGIAEIQINLKKEDQLYKEKLGTIMALLDICIKNSLGAQSFSQGIDGFIEEMKEKGTFTSQEIEEIKRAFDLANETN